MSCICDPSAADMFAESLSEEGLAALADSTGTTLSMPLVHAF